MQDSDSDTECSLELERNQTFWNTAIITHPRADGKYLLALPDPSDLVLDRGIPAFSLCTVNQRYCGEIQDTTVMTFTLYTHEQLSVVVNEAFLELFAKYYQLPLNFHETVITRRHTYKERCEHCRYSKNA